MSVLDNIKLGAHSHLNAGLFSSLWYWGAAHKEEMELRRLVEDDVIDFLEIEAIRKQPVGSLAYGLQKEWNWHGRWLCVPKYFSWTSL